MAAEIPPCFSPPPISGKLATSGADWHFRAWVLWHLIPPKVPMSGLAWLLGQTEKALERVRAKQSWPSRKNMRMESKEAAQKKEKEASMPTVRLNQNKNDLIFEGEIPRVSLTKLVKFVELMAKEAALAGKPGEMGSWLCNLAGIDGAIRARKTRQIDKITKDTVKIYLPAQDPIPAMDIEEAQVVAAPVVF